MRQCSRCGLEIPESATACSCSGSENSTAAVSEPPAMSASPESTPAPITASGLTRRQLLVMGLVLLGGAILSVMVLRLVSSSSRPAAEAKTVTPSKTTAATRSGAARSASSSAARASITPKWQGANPQWLGNDSKAVAFDVQAERRVQIWQRHAHPSLVVRCSNKQIEVFVFIESAAKMEAQDSDHTVRLTFDDEAEVTERWPDSYQHNALFAPDGAAFAARVLQARTVQFGYTPHNASRVVAEFHVAGLAQHLEPVARQCGMKK